MALLPQCFGYQVAFIDQLKMCCCSETWAATSFALLIVRPCVRQVPRRRVSSRQRTSRFMGVGSSNRKNQWQARILVHGKARRPWPCCQAPLHGLKVHFMSPVSLAGPHPSSWTGARVSLFC